MTVARKMLKGYKRALLIDTGVGDIGLLREQAQKIADLFGWRVETTQGSLTGLETVLQKALETSNLHWCPKGKADKAQNPNTEIRNKFKIPM